MKVYFSLCPEELCIVLNGPDFVHKLAIAGYIDYNKKKIKLYYHTGTYAIYSFDEFTSSDINPNFKEVSLIDCGHTLKLGAYEACISQELEW